MILPKKLREEFDDVARDYLIDHTPDDLVRMVLRVSNGTRVAYQDGDGKWKVKAQ